MIVGYARVSTDGQTLDAQQSALAGAEKVFAEKVSGAVTDRKALGRAIAAVITLRAPDVMHPHSAFDRYRESCPRRSELYQNCYSRDGDEQSAVPAGV